MALRETLEWREFARVLCEKVVYRRGRPNSHCIECTVPSHGHTGSKVVGALDSMCIYVWNCSRHIICFTIQRLVELHILQVNTRYSSAQTTCSKEETAGFMVTGADTHTGGEQAYLCWLCDDLVSKFHTGAKKTIPVHVQRSSFRGSNVKLLLYRKHTLKLWTLLMLHLCGLSGRFWKGVTSREECNMLNIDDVEEKER
jgi:hypothetical protein